MREVNLKIVNCQPIYFHHGDTCFFFLACGVYPLSGSHSETLHEKANSRPCLLFPEIKSVFVKQTKAMLDDYLFDRMMKNIEYVIDN